MSAHSRFTLQRRAVKLAAPGIARLLRAPQRARLDQFKTLSAPAGRIVFLGDSITEFGLWHEWFPNAPVLNRGIGGETSAQLAVRLDSAINAPLGVFLLIGTNDVTVSTSLITIAAHVRDIIDGIERRSPGTPVVLQSVLPRSRSYRDELIHLNRRFASIADAAGPHVQYLDLWSALSTPAGALRPAYTFDSLHLNGAGYRAWSEAIAPLVDQFAKTPTKEHHP